MKSVALFIFFSNNICDMKKLLLLLLLIILLNCSNKCEKFTKNYIPKNIKESYQYFDCNWSDELKEDFKNKSEEDLIFQHFGLGVWMRNSWNIWKDKNELRNFFNKHGIFILMIYQQ